MTSGRPRATSRATIAEAAAELFLEQGFEETTVADITQRAGVSRSSFFNYFPSKSAILWSTLDDGIRSAVAALRAGAAPHAALRGAIGPVQPDSLALAIIHGSVMGVSDELAEERAIRTGVLSRAVADRLVADGLPRLHAEVRAGALAAAALAAVWAWAGSEPPRRGLEALVDEALAIALPDR